MPEKQRLNYFIIKTYNYFWGTTFFTILNIIFIENLKNKLKFPYLFFEYVNLY